MKNIIEESIVHPRNLQKKGGEKEMKLRNNEKGITLIALIITIIILVILAAVSVRAVYEMGIAGYAVNGTQDYVRKSVEENQIYIDVESLMKSILNQLEESQGKKAIYMTDEEAKTLGLIFDKTTGSIMYDGIYNPKHGISTYTNLSGIDLVIPDYIDNVKVTYIPIRGFGAGNAGFDYDGNIYFSHACNAKSIIISSSVTTIESRAFMGCTSLATIELPKGLTNIGEYTFYGCTSLETIELPEGLTSIGNDAFNGCTSLETVELPEGLTSIGNNAFNGCTSLETIELPEGLTSIGNYTFNGCTSLETIELPKGLTSIGNNAFNGCTSLETVELPEGLTSIGNNAFSNCTLLTRVSYNGTKSQWNQILGSNKVYDITIQCTDGDLYISTPTPTPCCFDPGSQILMADGTTKNIENITIGDEVLSLNENTGVFISQIVTRIVVKHNSDDLVYVNLSNGVKIGMRAYHPLLTTEGWKSLRPELAETTLEAGMEVDILKVGDTLIGYKENVKIISIDTRPEIDNYDTYSFSVEGFHNYIVNGVVAHNPIEKPCTGGNTSGGER